jgi:hypothetical protein
MNYIGQELIAVRVTASQAFVVATGPCVLGTITLGRSISTQSVQILDGTSVSNGSTVLVLSSSAAVVTHPLNFRLAKGLLVIQQNATDDITYGIHPTP